MAALGPTTGLTLSHPAWLVLCLLVVPIIWLGWRQLASLGPVRRVLAAVLRCLVVALAALILAQPQLTRKNPQITVIAVLDRSQSIPPGLQDSALAYLDAALAGKKPAEQFALVDVAEAARISKLPSLDATFRHRNTSLTGLQTRLATGLEMALAIAPPDSASRILLLSDGNETSGDARQTARTAAANGIPIDVLPLRYTHPNEVIFASLSAPAKARSNQTVPLRFVLKSTAPASGRLLLTLNGKPVAIGENGEVEAPITLHSGTNVKTVSLPLGSRGAHEFRATFTPDDPTQDSITANNTASGITMVSGPGLVLVVDDGTAGEAIAAALKDAKIETRRIVAGEFPSELTSLLDVDAIVLVNAHNSRFTQQQQELMCLYVTQTGGGLVMVGGPDSFGAGGWIGSPLEAILPVDMDPPQKRQLPKGALVLIMHACEIPEGNYWGKKVAGAAINSLSQMDMAGVVQYGWNTGQPNWVFPFQVLSDKGRAIAAIDKMEMGDMPDFGPPMQAAYDELVKCDAAAKHVIIISDGDPRRPGNELIQKYKDAKITCSGVGINPHSPADVGSLYDIATSTGGRFYQAQDPQSLPQIFIREAQVVRRPLILEEPTLPQAQFSLHEILRGVTDLPSLDGLIVTGSKGGLAQLILTNAKGDPLLAATQAGLGRCVAFTSSADGRWARNWLAWGGFGRFWEQVVRWAGKPAQSTECDVQADVQGTQVTVSVETSDAAGKSIPLAQISGQIIAPDLSSRLLALEQAGPGKFRGDFQADSGGSYMLVLSYTKAGQEKTIGHVHTAISVPLAPEFRDAADNAAMLREIADITGGRVLSSDPGQGLFEAKGLKVPHWSRPLTAELICIWLGLFLLDVAVRRVAVDVAAIARRVARALARLRGAAPAAQATLEQLKSKKAEVQQQWTARRAARYAGADKPQAQTGPAPLPLEKPAATTAPAPASPEQKQPPPAPATSHLQQLLRAKRQAKAKPKGDQDENHPAGEGQ